MAGIHITDIEAAINWWRRRQPSPDGVRLAAPVRALAEEIGINSMTVSKAYTLLKQEGYIYTDRRSGARVRQEFETNKELSEKSQELLRQIISEAKVSGMTQTEFFDLCKRIYKG